MKKKNPTNRGGRELPGAAEREEAAIAEQTQTLLGVERRARAEAESRADLLNDLARVCDGVRGCTYSIAPSRFLSSTTGSPSPDWESSIDWIAYSDFLVSRAMVPAVMALRELSDAIRSSPEPLIMLPMNQANIVLRSRAELMRGWFWQLYIAKDIKRAATAVTSAITSMFTEVKSECEHHHRWFDGMHLALLACHARWAKGGQIEFSAPAREPEKIARRKPGRRVKYDKAADRRIVEEWGSGRYRTYDDFAKARGMSRSTITAALDRERKRAR